MERNMSDPTKTVGGNCNASPGHKTGDTITKTEEIFVYDIYNASYSELAQTYELSPKDKKVSQYDIKPYITDLVTVPNFKVPQSFEAYPHEDEESQSDVKPCVTNLSKEPDCGLLQTCEIFPMETNVNHYDVESYVPMNSLDGSRSNCVLPETHKVLKTETEESQTDISNVENFSSSCAEPGQIQRVVDLKHKRRSSRPKEATASVSDSDVESTYALIPKHKTRHISVLPVLITDNGVSKSVSCLSNSKQNAQVSYEGDCETNRMKIKMTKSAILKPVSNDLFQSNIDNLVSRDEDLKNDSTTKLISSWMQIADPVKDSQYKCDDCGSFFKRKCQLHQHVKAHTTHREDDSDTSECSDVDSRRFTSKVTSNQHVNVEKDEELFKCTVCCKTFNKKSLFHRHLRSHTGERPYKCNECGKSFKQNGHLRDHILGHREIKPIKCHECGKSFRRKSGLHKHMQLHTGEKKFECEECYKRFRNKYSLYRHFMSIHRREQQKFECKECSKRFADIDKLNRHMRGHTGDKPYQCHECGKCFYQSYTLRVHMRTHTGEKPFQCNECGKLFGHKCSLQFHLRVHKRGKK